ncbi:MAG: tRNA (N(6)-L-threonylcarbamoyladenosine(37)-C(2))-methylthiotransferase [Nanoarchaeota archaeon]|nr:tRNA (N(6)-L-threonylcarbamoyladenosine(37)-C(2))-methylthiotransferase [Nanoarchaeota archaeon]
MQKIYIQTHGCSTNFSESEIMGGLLDKAGFDIVSKIEDPDIIIINTCTVKGETTSLREIRKIKEEFPDKNLLVAGCLTKELIIEIRKITEDASLINTHNIARVVEVVEEMINGNIFEAISGEGEKKINMPKIRKNPVIGIVPILAGCNNKCSYCSVKLVKGKLISYPWEDIIGEVENALKSGCREIWVTSQDNAAYGTEKIWRSSLPELLNDIIAIDKGFKIRLGMMNPKNIRPIVDDLIEVYKSDKMFKFLHLPVQSGNNEILEKMRRGYFIEDFKDMINKFRREIPNLTVSTDIIAGFPGETVEQFNDSLDVLKELRPDVLNISRFIARPRTEAFYIKDKVLDAAIKDRTRIMTDIFQNISRMNNEKWLDWEGEILIDEKGKADSWIGRNFAYKQVIVNGSYKLGQKVDVKVANTTIFDLRGERI